MKKTLRKAIFYSFFFLFNSLFIFFSASSQVNPCTPNTPSYTVNLSGNPGGTWVSSPPIVRDGSCCGSEWPDRCIVFLITLDTGTIAINFNIASGAIPPGAMFYQIDCSTPTQVGQPICLEGPGPYALTFCKPGANLNTYAITAIAGPEGPPDASVGIGCSISLSVSGLNPSTVTWNSIFPGASGAFNNYLNCTAGCTTTVVTPIQGAPAFVDYKVCGQSLAPSCLPDPNFCDTVRVYLNPALNAGIAQDTAYFCNSMGGVTLTANVSGGDGNYFQQWTNQNGAVLGTNPNYFASAPGIYIFQVYDGQYPGCPAKFDTVIVTQQTIPILNAGSDQTICSGGSVILSGTLSGGTGVAWTGGGGFYNPNNTSMNVTYTPSPTEIAAGSATLTFSSTGNGVCPAGTDQVTIFIKPQLTTSVSGSTIVCFGASTQLTANVTGGTYPYTYIWNTGSTASTIIANPGNYSVTVTDMSSGTCTSVATFSVLQDPQVSVSVTPGTSIVCSMTTGINANPSGGTGSYSYQWNTGQTSVGIIVYPGIYTVTVTDGVGCSATGTVSVAGINSTLAVSISQPASLCFGGTKNITAVGTGGSGGYNFQWSTGQTSQTINVSAGTYCCTVTDAVGCISTGCVIVNQNSPLSVSITNPSPVCSGTMDDISAVPNGGQSPYTYLWSTGQTSQTIIQGAGTYSITVSDANQNGGCTASSSAVVYNEPTFSIALTGNNVSCFGGTNGNASVSASGGIPGYTYQWSPAGGNATTAGNLSAGSYTVVVTDNIGCTKSGTLNIAEPLVLFASISVNANVNCNGGNNGNATVSVSGGNTPYSFQWSPYGGTGVTATGLTAETYTVTLTDAKGCSNSASTVVTQPATLTATISSTNIACNSGNNGTATVSPSGGTSPFSFLWSNGAVSQNISSLSNGNYSVTVTDNKGCTVTKTTTVAQPSGLVAGISSSSNVSCNGAANGSAIASATGGTSPYTFSWSSGLSAQSINSLIPGNYSMTSTDANGCTSSAGVTITQPAILMAAASPDQNIPCNTTVTLSSAPTGGTTSYSYQWNNGATTQNITLNTPGTYIVTVTDANNCSAIDSVFVMSTNSALNVTISAPLKICNGATASVSANPTGGTGGYTYLWTSGQTGATISASAGIHCVTVTDNSGCKMTACTIIQNEPSFSVSVNQTATCFAAPQTITANVSGGISPYSFSWSTGETTQAVIKNAGTYSVTVTDSILCSSTVTTTLSEADLLLVGFSNVYNVTCKGDNNGIATANPDGGISGYTYQWSPVVSSNSTVYNLSPGTYTVTVTDAIGCTGINSVTISEPSSLLSLDSIDGNNIACFGGSTGNATVAATGGNSPFNYLWWYDSDTVGTNTNLPAGYYNISVADTNGCIAAETIYLSQPPKLNLGAGTIAHVSCYGGATGVATTQVSGGKTPYSYFWSNGGTTATVSGLTAGNYTVTVTDANGCTVQSSIVQVAQPTSINLIPTKLKPTCSSSDGSVFVNVTGGTAPYSYNWSPGGNITAYIQNVDSGTYYVTVTDNSNCMHSEAIILLADTESINIAYIPTSAICTSPTGAISVTPTTGTPSYSYLWSNGSTTQAITGIPAGTYFVTVTDSSGCVGNQTITLPATISTVTLNGYLQQINCYGESNGSITVDAGGGASPYTYTWIYPSSSGPLIDNLPSGNYTISVMDANSCKKDSTFYLPQPSPINLMLSGRGISCKGNSDGQISISVSGGTSPFTFNWLPNISTNDSANDLSTGVYAVTVTDSKGCTSTISDTIVEPLQMLTIDVDTSTNASCFGGENGTASVSGTGGTSPYSYLWSTGDQTPNAVSLSKGNYYVTVTDNGGCTIVDSVSITEPDEIEIGLAGGDSLCYGKSVLMTAVASGGNGNFTFTWVGIGNGPTQFITPTKDSIFTVIATDAKGCSDTSKIYIYVIPPVSASVSASGTSICSGQSTSIAAIASGGVSSSYSYSWTPMLGTGPGPFTINPTDNISYTVIVNDGCSNPDTAAITITVNPTPFTQPIWLPDTGCAPLPLNFSTSIAGNPPGTVYLWDFGDGTTFNGPIIPHTYSQAGIYYPSITVSIGGCSATFTNDSAYVIVHQTPFADFTATPQPAYLSFPEITFNDNSFGGNNFQWSFGDGSTASNPSGTFTHNYIDTGTYTATLIVNNEFNCPDTFTQEIKIIPEFQFWIPNAFTPGTKNGKNDFFVGKGICIDDYEMYIFDRWGDEIYHTTDINKPWDGRAHAGRKIVQIGVYIYLINVWDCIGEYHPYFGHVTVVK